MRVAITGKGGSGKTVVAALLARHLSSGGRRVLAVDLDTNPGLALSLGLRAADVVLPDEAVAEREGTPYGWGLADGLTPAEVVHRFAVPVSERLFFLGFGNISGASHPLSRYLTAVRTVADRFDEPGWATVLDLEAGPATPFEGFARAATLALVLVEATPASVLAAQRIRSILDHDGTPSGFVAAQVREDAEVAFVAENLEAPLACVPFDPQVRELERRGSLALLPPDSPAAVAIQRLVDSVSESHEEEVPA
ncbi:MAG: AAA family ATPase [Actinomycetota bacterium]|nr:AAA family ATPase [Actinomycetota bacterium]